MTNDEFREMLNAAGYTRQRFADLIGVELTAVKRWVAHAGAKSKRPVPPHAVLLLRGLIDGRLDEPWISSVKVAHRLDRGAQ